MSTLITLLRKEVIENKGSCVWLPVIVGAVLIALVAGSLLFQQNIAVSLNGDGLTGLSELTKETSLEDRHQVTRAVLSALTVPFLIPLSLVVIFYLSHALFDERKDRSILFWKSLPVSDRLTVLSKVMMAIVVFPLSYWLMLSITQVLFLSLISVYGLMVDLPVWPFLFQPGLVLGHAVTYLLALIAQGFWLLPIYAYVLFCSSWAPRSPLMVSLAILAIISLTITGWRMLQLGQPLGFEPLGWVGRRFGESPLPLSFKLTVENPSEAMGQTTNVIQVLETFLSPMMWLGWLIALPLLVGAVMMRRRATA
ncbi:MAG TPA: hypothetical protein VIC53_09685 [Wenzhouxiangella sp.]